MPSTGSPSSAAPSTNTAALRPHRRRRPPEIYHGQVRIVSLLDSFYTTFGAAVANPILLVGRMDVFGPLSELADTPASCRAPPVPGQHTRRILR
jgi:hypothetical protein